MKKIILDIGFKNSILTKNIEGIFSYKISSYAINLDFFKKKEDGGLINKNNQRKRKSFILFKDGSIIISPLEIETLVKRSK